MTVVAVVGMAIFRTSRQRTSRSPRQRFSVGRWLKRRLSDKSAPNSHEFLLQPDSPLLPLFLQSTTLCDRDRFRVQCDARWTREREKKYRRGEMWDREKKGTLVIARPAAAVNWFASLRMLRIYSQTVDWYHETWMSRIFSFFEPHCICPSTKWIIKRIPWYRNSERVIYVSHIKHFHNCTILNYNVMLIIILLL